MLLEATRPEFKTLLDAITLTEADDQTALIFVETDQPDQVISRKVFLEAVQAYAGALQILGLQAGDLVLIAHAQNLESMYLFWGALYMGALPSMFPTLSDKLDPDIYISNMRQLADFSKARLLLTSDDFAPLLRRALKLPVVASAELDLRQPMVEAYAARPEATAFLQHTSGTTGLQKGIMLSHQAVLNQLGHYAEAISLQADDVIVSWLPLYHDMGLIAGFIQPIVQGIPLVLMSPFDWVQHPALLLKAIDQHRGSLCWLPNFAYHHMARRIRQRDSEHVDLSSMRLWINCSEPVYASTHRLFYERFAANGVQEAHLQVSYAMAENTFAVTQSRESRVIRIDANALHEEQMARVVAADDPQALEQLACGPAIAGVALKVVDPVSRQRLAEGQVGEMMVKSDSMLSGYHERPDLEPIEDGFYATGDMAYMLDGQVYIVGRYKDLIINAGKNIYPQDLEALIQEVPGVHPGRVVVFGVYDEREGTELIAAVAEVDTQDPAEKKVLAKGIRQRVGQGSSVTLNYLSLVEAGWLIKTSSGKIARSANRDKWRQQEKGDV